MVFIYDRFDPNNDSFSTWTLKHQFCPDFLEWNKNKEFYKDKSFLIKANESLYGIPSIFNHKKKVGDYMVSKTIEKLDSNMNQNLNCFLKKSKLQIHRCKDFNEYSLFLEK